MFLSEADTAAMLHVMIDNSSRNPMYYLNMSVKEVAQFNLSFDRLISRHLWFMHKRISRSFFYFYFCICIFIKYK